MKKCPACHRAFDDSQSFCLEDGTPLTVESPVNSKETIVLPRRKSKLPLILGGLLLLVGASAIAWFLLASREQAATTDSGKKIAANVQTPVSTPTPVPTETPTPSPSPSPTVSPEANTNAAVNSETNSKPPTESNTSKPLPTLMKAEEHQVVFNLQQCRKSGTSITCDFTLTNTGQDRRFRLSGYKSRLFDELGNGYKGSDVQVANQSGDSAEIGFINGVTAKAQMTFDNIEPNAAKITLLSFGFLVGNDYDLEVKFRNVPLVGGK